MLGIEFSNFFIKLFLKGHPLKDDYAIASF